MPSFELKVELSDLPDVLTAMREWQDRHRSSITHFRSASDAAGTVTINVGFNLGDDHSGSVSAALRRKRACIAIKLTLYQFADSGRRRFHLSRAFRVFGAAENRAPPAGRSTAQRVNSARRAAMAWTAQDFRDKAQRCRELLRVAIRDDVREQLREWAADFDAEAERIERPAEASWDRRV